MGERGTGSPDEDLRIGPYDVFRTIVDMPGGRIIEARDSTGEQRLLQVAYLRAAVTAEEQAQLTEYVRMIATATAHFETDPDVRVLSHGTTPRGGGALSLFWALPWKDGAERLGRAQELVRSPDDLIDVAIALLQRVLDRHERGRLDPMLCEQLVIVRDNGTAVLAGVPIHLPPDWVASDLGRPRFAPEEQLRFEPTRTGDMWRLGQTLRALAAPMEPLPSTVRRFVDALSDPDPELRMTEPVRAIKELQQIRSSRPRSRPREPLPETLVDTPLGDATIRRVTPGNQSDDLPSAESLRASFEADRTDRTPEPPPEPPLANMRSSAPDPRAAGSLKQIAEAPTILEMKPPSALRAVAASALEARRRMIAAHATPPAGTGEPSILGSDTIVDVRPSFEDDYLTGEEPTIDGLRLPRPPPVQVNVDILDPVEAPGADEPQLPPGAGSAWDRAKDRNARARAAMTPQGPSGTVVGVRQMGPAGTVVGINPVRAKERLSEGLAPEPTVTAPEEPKRGSTIVGVPSLRFRGRDNTPEDADALPISPPSARLIAGGDTGDFVPPASLRAVSGETSDDMVVDRDFGRVRHEANPLAAQTPGQPASLPFDDPAETIPPPNRLPPVAPPPVAPPPVAPPPPRKRSSSSREWVRRLPLVAALGVALGASVVFAGRQLVPDRTARPTSKPTEITAASEVVLSVLPRDAIVIGERDGRVLGETPLTFLVPNGGGIPVLITAPDREPQRLILPDRGTVNTTLRRMENAAPCDVMLAVQGDREIEGIVRKVERLDKSPGETGEDPTVGPPRAYRVPGAAVVRLKGGGGAWIAFCPALGGTQVQTLSERPEPEERRFHVVEPENLLLFVDDRLGGATPCGTTVQTGFVEVRLEAVDGATITRWIPAFGDTYLKMPGTDRAD